MYFSESDVFYMGKIIKLICKTSSITPNKLVLGRWKLCGVNLWDIWLNFIESASARVILNNSCYEFLPI